MADRDIEHHTEVRSGSRRGAVLLVAAVVAVGVAAVVLQDGDDASTSHARAPGAPQVENDQPPNSTSHAPAPGA